MEKPDLIGHSQVLMNSVETDITFSNMQKMLLVKHNRKLYFKPFTSETHIVLENTS